MVLTHPPKKNRQNRRIRAKRRFAPVGDCIPDRNDPPPRKQRTEDRNPRPVAPPVVIPEFSSRAGAMLNVRNECNRAG